MQGSIARKCCAVIWTSASAAGFPLMLALLLAYTELPVLAQGKLVNGSAPLVPALVIFGDSTVDSGNNNALVTVVKSNFPPYGRSFPGGLATGRFSDGLLATDYLASYLGLPYTIASQDPEAQGDRIVNSVSFASAASGWDESTAKHFNVESLTTQLNLFRTYKQQVLDLLGPEKANTILGGALYFFSTGTKDYVNNYFLNLDLQAQYTSEQYQILLLEFARGYIQELYDEGARNIAVANTPPIGCISSQITLYGCGVNCSQPHNDAATAFNAALDGMLENLKPTMPGSRLIAVDVYTPASAVFHNPSLYGFTETTKACCGTGLLETAILYNEASLGTCTDASSYLFFDSFHPTDRFNKIIAQSVVSQVAPRLAESAQP